MSDPGRRVRVRVGRARMVPEPRQVPTNAPFGGQTGYDAADIDTEGGATGARATMDAARRHGAAFGASGTTSATPLSRREGVTSAPVGRSATAVRAKRRRSR